MENICACFFYYFGSCGGDGWRFLFHFIWDVQMCFFSLSLKLPFHYKLVHHSQNLLGNEPRSKELITIRVCSTLSVAPYLNFSCFSRCIISFSVNSLCLDFSLPFLCITRGEWSTFMQFSITIAIVLGNHSEYCTQIRCDPPPLTIYFVFHPALALISRPSQRVGLCCSCILCCCF